MNGSQQYVNGTYLILVYYIFADLIMCGDHAMTDENEDRRRFLKSCGKFAVVTPPAITMLLSTSLTSDAVAHSGGGGSYNHPGNSGGGGGNSGGGGPYEHHGSYKGNNGYGNGGWDGSPNGKEDNDR